MAGWVTIVGSVFVVFGLFETVANLRSIETREQVERLLSQPPLEGTSMTLERWLSVMHTVSLVGAACAAAAAILGFYVLQRSTSARAALSVVAVPLFLTGMVTSGFMSTLVAVSVLMLWTKPARDWFAGRPWLDSMMSSRIGAATSRRRTSDLEDPSSAQPPMPPPMPWEQAAEPAPQPPEGAATPRPVVPADRPTALVAACVLTWVSAGVVAFGSLLGLAAMLVAPDLWSEQMRRDLTEQAGVTWDQARRAAMVAMVVFGTWSLVAALLAVFALLGREWARLLLVVSASAAAMLCAWTLVAGGLAGLLMLLPLAACVATVALLLRGDVSGWVRGRSTR